MTLRLSIEVADQTPKNDISKRSHAMTLEMPSVERMEAVHVEAGQPPSKDNCDGRDESDPTISIPQKAAGSQTVAPFLARHIPDQYAPLGGAQPTIASKKDPNTKYCYRHRPDSKCRRTADEPTMENLQRVC